mmetsp:Transcript_52704/g.115544  ORF Transcript_52704/g.115544 Transcript_52704/m.115544 type:complete len:222 (-) Transcript_52704:415-1080(-)
MADPAATGLPASCMDKNVLWVAWNFSSDGLKVRIIRARFLPSNARLRSLVSLLSLYGTCFSPLRSASRTLPRLKCEELMARLSVILSPLFSVFRLSSQPAKSTRYSLPARDCTALVWKDIACLVFAFGACSWMGSRLIWRQQCEREDSSFKAVLPTLRCFRAPRHNSRICAAEVTSMSWRPAITTSPAALSRIGNHLMSRPPCGVRFGATNRSLTLSFKIS